MSIRVLLGQTGDGTGAYLLGLCLSQITEIISILQSSLAGDCRKLYCIDYDTYGRIFVFCLVGFVNTDSVRGDSVYIDLGRTRSTQSNSRTANVCSLIYMVKKQTQCGIYCLSQTGMSSYTSL